MSHGIVVRIVTAYGIELMPLKSTSASRGIGILIRGSKGFFDTWIDWIISGRRVQQRVRSTDRAPRLTGFGCRRPGSHLTNLLT